MPTATPLGEPAQCSVGALCPKSQPAAQALSHWQLVVAVGDTSSVALNRSKPCVRGEEVMPPSASLSLYREPRCLRVCALRGRG